MSELTINVSQLQADPAATVIRLSGHLHGETEHNLIDSARQAHDAGSKYLLLDLSDLDVLTSAGLRAIQLIFKLFTPKSDLGMINQHGEEPYKSPYFKIVCPKPQIYYVLNIAGFLQNIPIYNNMEEAVTSLA